MEYCVYGTGDYRLYRIEERKREMKFIVLKSSGNLPSFCNQLPAHTNPSLTRSQTFPCFLHTGDYSASLLQNFSSIAIFCQEITLSYYYYICVSVYLYTYMSLHCCRKCLEILKRNSCFSGPLLKFAAK
jgi:hypothetical protein